MAEQLTLILGRTVQLFEQACKRERCFDVAPESFYEECAKRALYTTKYQLDPAVVLAHTLHNFPDVKKSVHPPALLSFVDEQTASVDLGDVEKSKKWMWCARRLADWLRRCPRELMKSTTPAKALNVIAPFCTEPVKPPLDLLSVQSMAAEKLRVWFSEEPIEHIVDEAHQFQELPAHQDLHLRVREAAIQRISDIARRKADAIAAAKWESDCKASAQREARLAAEWRTGLALIRKGRQLRYAQNRTGRSVLMKSIAALESFPVKNSSKSMKLPASGSTPKARRAARKADAKVARKAGEVKSRTKSGSSNMKKPKGNMAKRESKSRTAERLLARSSKMGDALAV